MIRFRLFVLVKYDQKDLSPRQMDVYPKSTTTTRNSKKKILTQKSYQPSSVRKLQIL